MNLKIQYILL